MVAATEMPVLVQNMLCRLLVLLEQPTVQVQGMLLVPVVCVCVGVWVCVYGVQIM